MRRARFLGLSLFLVALVLAQVGPAPSQVDFGRWRAVVLHSDDWGLEGWVPGTLSAELRRELAEGIPAWQSPYLTSTLESAEDVQSLAGWMLERRDLDGLPVVLQANSVVAGPDVEAGCAGYDCLRPVGSRGAYRRPGLDEAVDAAIAAGVWWPELHGLTHYDLVAWERARDEGDPLLQRAAREGVLAWEGYRTAHELGHPDEERALRTARLSVEAFRSRYGRAPSSVIAPDYRWCEADEKAWSACGLRIVQAKREQVDPGLALNTWHGRLRKWIDRQLFRLSADFAVVERTVDLEPYGDVDPESAQGAMRAIEKVRGAWAGGEPGAVSMHRVQLVNRDSRVSRAGLAHLDALHRGLAGSGGVRYLVDVEIEQLRRRGWSDIERGPWRIVRNWTAAPVRVPSEDGSSLVAPVGTSVLARNPGREHERSRN